jgi:neutral ceramidase
MLIGTGRRVINPEVGHHLAGYGPDYPNTGVHDDLCVTALYVHDGKRTAFLLNFDLVGFAGVTVASLQGAVARATGVKARQVYLTCTHTHSGPDVVESWGLRASRPRPSCRPDYLERLHGWAAAAAQEASGNAEECQVRYNFTDVPGNMNRRYNFPDRRYMYIPDNKQLAGQSREYVDRELGIIAFRKRGTPNQYKAVLTNYTCHPLCVGNASNLVSADFQGVLRRTVEETFTGCLCLATTGAAGDNHPLMPESGFATAREMGTRLAQQAILRTYDSVPVDYDQQLRLAYPEVTLKAKDEATRRMLPEKAARRQKAATKLKEYKTRVSLLGIGPILLAGFPGEPMAEHGAMLKWSSPFLKTYALFEGIDMIGYFPTVNQFYWGGYEADTTPFARGSGEKLVGRILEAAHELIARKPLLLPALDVQGTHGHPS